jgi:hypothetical protein
MNSLSRNKCEKRSLIVLHKYKLFNTNMHNLYIIMIVSIKMMHQLLFIMLWFVGVQKKCSNLNLNLIEKNELPIELQPIDKVPFTTEIRSD